MVKVWRQNRQKSWVTGTQMRLVWCRMHWCWRARRIQGCGMILNATSCIRRTKIGLLGSASDWLWTFRIGSRTPQDCVTTGRWHIGLASDDVRKLSNTWQRGKLVLNKGSAPYKSMQGEKSLTWRSSLFLRREVRTVLTTPSLLSAVHFQRWWGSDKCGAVFRSIDDLPACFCMGRYLCFRTNFAGCYAGCGAVT